MHEVVRRATADDCEELARLEALARSGIEDVRGGSLRLQECQPIVDWAELIADPDKVVFVGTLDDSVVAFLAMDMCTSSNRGRISYVYVEVEGRELGLGDALVQEAVDAVLARGLSGIEAVALPGDRDTKNLFERAGLTARKLTVYKSLGPASMGADTVAPTPSSQ